MTELVCIVCPNGCTLHIEGSDETLTVTGNACKRGEAFAKTELTYPMRTLCTTVRTQQAGVPVLPVRTNGEIPKEKLFDVMRLLDGVTLVSPVARGDVVVKNVCDTGVDIIATSDRMQRAAKHAIL